MKKTFLTLLVAGLAMTAAAQGWPSGYGGVMLQGFYWDSFNDTKWTNLTSQADELSAYFDIIWVPQSGQTSDGSSAQQMGYSPCYWLNHNTIFGTESELRTMISTFRAKGTGIMEDVVINHKNGYGSWVYFPNESKNGYSITWDNTNYSGICNTDECNRNGYPTTGAADTGDDFDGNRDLDHTNSTVQNNIKTYLSFLLNDLGYCGFRYDMVKGFDAIYCKMYTNDAKPTYSVGECYDMSYNVVRNWIVRGGYTSAAFDFPLKNNINRAFNNATWSYLDNDALARNSQLKQYSVTFVENHDTDRDSQVFPNSNRILAANAYILAMPGTPCIFLKHWKTYKGELSRMILARKAAGVTNTSTITSQGTENGSYVVKVQGTNGSVMCVLGPTSSVNLAGYKAVSVSTTSGKEYGYYVSENITVGEGITSEIPAQAVETSDQYYAYFEAPSSSWTDVKAWAWNDNNYTGGTWPGASCTLVATLSNGNKLWRWSYNDGDYNTHYNTPPSYIIFSNNGSPQTENLEFVNGGYYNTSGYVGCVIQEEEEEVPTITVYIRTSDSNLHIYGWNASGTLTDGWPGSEVTQTSTLYNELWKCYTFYNQETVNFLLNCGGDGTKTSDITGITSNVFIEYHASTKSYTNITAEVTGEEEPEVTLPDEATWRTDVKYFAYFEAPSGWDPVYAWAWNDNNYTGGTWPGEECIWIVDLDGGKKLWRWEYNGAYSTPPSYIIFNNNDNGKQTDNLDFVNGGYYNSGGFVSVVDESNVEEEEEDPNPDAITIYVKTTSTNPYIYAWGSETPDSWPGYQMTQTKSLFGEEWYYHKYDMNPVNVIINMGSDATKTADITGITHNTFIQYNQSGSSAANRYSIITNDVTENGGSTTIPSDAVYVLNVAGFTYFEAPSSWEEPIYAWAWNSSKNFTGGEWPGKELKSYFTTSNGNKVYLWSYPLTRSASDEPTYILFSDANHMQTDDFVYENAGYYNAAYEVGTVSDTVTDIEQLPSQQPVDNRVFTIDGRFLGNYNVIGSNLPRGFYIVGGKKILK